MVDWLQKEWARCSGWQILLRPFSWLFFVIIGLRRALYKTGVLNSTQLPVPVIVVGNLNVGGTGKTPLVIWLAEQLSLQGYHPGVISRGYTAVKTQHQRTAKEVQSTSLASEVGDEPVLLASRLQCPVFVCSNRVVAGRALLAAHPQCDVIISDDGLQHYALARQYEIVVVDAEKKFGNQALLPAGPLREPMARLRHVNAIVVNGLLNSEAKAFAQQNLTVIDRHIGATNANGDIAKNLYAMQLVANSFYYLHQPQQQLSAASFRNQKIIAIAGIGHPARFFSQLERMGVDFSSRAFPDHHAFTQQDIAALDADVILMTEKDAVKCRDFADARCWVLPASAHIDIHFLPSLLRTIAIST